MSTGSHDRSAIGPALGRLPSGLFVCVCGTGETAVPFVASWVQQASFEPPAVSVAIARRREALARVADEGIFVLSQLPQDARELARRFFVDAARALAEVPSSPTPRGGRYLRDALSWLECRALDRHEVGDHVLVVGEVLAGGVLGEGHPWVHVRQDGFRY